MRDILLFRIKCYGLYYTFPIYKKNYLLCLSMLMWFLRHWGHYTLKTKIYEVLLSLFFIDLESNNVDSKIAFQYWGISDVIYFKDFAWLIPKSLIAGFIYHHCTLFEKLVYYKTDRGSVREKCIRAINSNKRQTF